MVVASLVSSCLCILVLTSGKKNKARWKIDKVFVVCGYPNWKYATSDKITKELRQVHFNWQQPMLLVSKLSTVIS